MASGSWLGLTKRLEGVARVRRAPESPPLYPSNEIGALLRDIEPEPLKPVWGGRLFLGKVHMFDGDPHCGKTMIALDLAARITTGRPFPDGSAGIGPAGVVYFTAEDDPADTLRPRLDAAGGDPSRYVVVILLTAMHADGTIYQRLPTLEDEAVILSAIERVKAKLVVFDPFMAYLTKEVGENSGKDMRIVLTALVWLARRAEAIFLMVRHLNKAVGMSAVQRGSGSMAIVGTARAGLVAARDHLDASQCVLASSKTNLSAQLPSWAYRIITGEGGAPVVEWLGESAHTADSLVGRPGPDKVMGLRQPPKSERVRALLRELLAGGTHVPIEQIQARAGRGHWAGCAQRGQEGAGRRIRAQDAVSTVVLVSADGAGRRAHGSVRGGDTGTPSTPSNTPLADEGTAKEVPREQPYHQRALPRAVRAVPRAGWVRGVRRASPPPRRCLPSCTPNCTGARTSCPWPSCLG